MKDWFRIHKDDFQHTLVDCGSWKKEDFEKSWNRMKNGEMDVTDMWDTLESLFWADRKMSIEEEN